MAEKGCLTMRPNIRMTSEELMLAQVRRAQELRNSEWQPREDGLQDFDVETWAYFCTLGLTIIGIVVVLALA